ncbi:unnamed protein product [Ambrosiozyma monospora]|uniref:Unnamed protein product n=1 Tax=Ambrosiozyma monospora TaxID=43982 RepID=A0A9W6YXE4_AMBMO|nr:unnamed protein product [Ambrosiozyma monospora]
MAHLGNGSFISQIPIAMGKGVRQGSPISAFIFILAIEHLLRCLSSSINGIHFQPTGLSFPTAEWKSAFTTKVTALAYADDLAVGCSNPSELHHIFGIIHQFASFSGCTLNNQKTKLYSNNNNNIVAYQGYIATNHLQIETCPINSNPTYLGSPLLAMDWPSKFRDILNKFRKILYLDLTLSHRVTAINTYIYSQVYFLDQHHPCAESALNDFIKQIHQMLIAHLPYQLTSINNILHAPRKQGGLGLLDLHSQLSGRRGFYIYQLVRNSNMSHPLVSMMNSMLQQLANILVCHQTIDGELNDLPSISPLPLNAHPTTQT